MNDWQHRFYFFPFVLFQKGPPAAQCILICSLRWSLMWFSGSLASNGPPVLILPNSPSCWSFSSSSRCVRLKALLFLHMLFPLKSSAGQQSPIWGPPDVHRLKFSSALTLGPALLAGADVYCNPVGDHCSRRGLSCISHGPWQLLPQNVGVTSVHICEGVLVCLGKLMSGLQLVNTSLLMLKILLDNRYRI